MGEFTEITSNAFERLFNDVASVIGFSVLYLFIITLLALGTYEFITDAIVGTGLIIFGLLISIFVAGYMVDNYRAIIKKKPLPKVLGDLKGRFIRGINYYIISIAWAILITAISIPFFLYSETMFNTVVLIVGIILSFPIIASILEYSKSLKLKDAFKKEVIFNAYKTKFVLYVIGGAIIGYLIFFLLALTIVGLIIAGLGLLYMQHMFVAGYFENKKSKRSKKTRSKKVRRRKKK